MDGMNINLIIGDNAIGKTRYLKRLAGRCQENNYKVVTNIDKYNKNVVIDDNKVKLAVSKGNELIERIILNGHVKNDYDSNLKHMLELVCAKGDILIIDELEAGIDNTNMMWIIMAISDIRELWKEIWVTGYDIALMRLFLDVDEDGHEHIEHRVYTIVNGSEIKKLAEDEIDEYFDKL